MGLTVKKGATSKRIIPESGNHLARCISIIDLGTQHWEFNGEKKSGHKVRITWELPEATDTETGNMPIFDEEKGPQPFVVSDEYTVSINPKSKLRPLLESWMGRKFTAAEEETLDLKKFLGKICLINVVHQPDKKDSSRTYANVGGVTPPMKGMKCPNAINPLINFDMDAVDKHTIFATLHDFIKKKIEASDEWKTMQANGDTGGVVTGNIEDGSNDEF